MLKPLKIQEEEEHGQSFASWPWQKDVFKHVFLSIEITVLSGLEINKLPLIAQLHYRDTGSCKEMFIMIHNILFKHNDKRNI